MPNKINNKPRERNEIQIDVRGPNNLEPKRRGGCLSGGGGGGGGIALSVHGPNNLPPGVHGPNNIEPTAKKD